MSTTDYFGTSPELDMKTIQLGTYFFLEIYAHAQDRLRRETMNKYLLRYDDMPTHPCVACCWVLS